MKEELYGSSWGVTQRLKFIDSKLYWESRVNRSDLVEAFSISAQQASADFSAYHNKAPTNLVYDPRLKGYTSSVNFSPIFEVENPYNYLEKLSSHDLVSITTPVEQLPKLNRQITPTVVRGILSAIRANNGIEITYRSMSHPEASTRWIEPHSIASDGERWHVRAYCYKRESFVDFNISRIESLGSTRKAVYYKEQDFDWQNSTIVRFIAHPKLDNLQRSLLENDLGMENGEISFTVRNAMLFYLLHRYGRNNNLDSDNPNIFQVVLANESELREKLKSLSGEVINKLKKEIP